MCRPKVKNKWLFLGVINIMVLLISAMMIFCSHQDEVGAGFSYQYENRDELAIIYSTAELKKGVYVAEISYKIGGGAIHTVP